MADSKDNQPICLYCKQDSQTVPLIQLRYQGEDMWICPQHLPILIHNPAMLIGILPGAENFEEAGHHDHD